MHTHTTNDILCFPRPKTVFLIIPPSVSGLLEKSKHENEWSPVLCGFFCGGIPLKQEDTYIHPYHHQILP